MMLAHAGLGYEFRTVTFADWMGGVKEQMPAGHGGAQQLPIFRTLDGKMMPETADIAAHIASLAPDKLRPGAAAKEMFEATNSRPLSLAMPLTNWFGADDSDQRLPAFVAAAVPLLAAYDAQLGEQVFFRGADGPHYGEFGLWHVVDLVRGLQPSVLDGLGSLKKWYARMAALPGVADYGYLAARPKAMCGKVGREGSVIATRPIDG